jgi:hypothetical protein
MTAEETADVLGESVHIIRHDLRYAHAWLRRKLSQPTPPSSATTDFLLGLTRLPGWDRLPVNPSAARFPGFPPHFTATSSWNQLCVKPVFVLMNPISPAEALPPDRRAWPSMPETCWPGRP